LQHGCEQRGAWGKMRTQEVLMAGMRTFSYCAHAIEGGHTERGGEVAV
jgi:hypothetical protein